MSYDVDQLIATARKRLDAAKAADEHNREEAQTDLLFRVLKQWDESLKTQRENADPPRPCIVVDRLSAFCNQVVNETRQAKPQPSVSPRGNGATKETAEVIEGKIRDILYDSDSELAFQESVKYAIVSSQGEFRLDPEVVDYDTGRQELRVNPIYDPSTVYWDPFAKRPDKADARWCLVVNIISRIEYVEKWGEERDQARQDFFKRDDPGDMWLDPNGDKDAVMVAEYWCVEKLNSDAVALGLESDEDWQSGKLDDWVGRHAKKTGRTDDGYRVVRHLIDGAQELEKPEVFPGKFIPIFAVEGDSFWVKGKRYLTSLIRSARDIQRLYNWEATKEVEILAMQATSPYLVTPKQVQNHEPQWQAAPNKNFFYLKFNPDPDMPGPPGRASVDAPIQAISQAKAMTAQEIKDVIGLQDPNLGRAQSPNQSGVAVQQLRTEGDTATYHFSDNLTRTMKHFCRVLVSWLPYYYDLEQDLKILKADMTEEQVKINTAQPVMGPQGKPYQHDFTRGNYECVVKIGPGYDTEREEEADFYANLIAAHPDAFWVLGDVAIRTRNSAGADVAADRVKRAIALKTPGLIQDDENALPPGAAAQVQGMQAQMQQMGQMIQQLQMALKMQIGPKQIEAQKAITVEHIKSRTAIIKAAADIQTKLAKMRIDQENNRLKHGHDMYATHLSEATDAIEHLMTMLHETEMAPSPDAGPQGMHPSAPPMPAQGNQPNGAA